MIHVFRTAVRKGYYGQTINSRLFSLNQKIVTLLYFKIHKEITRVYCMHTE